MGRWTPKVDAMHAANTLAMAVAQKTIPSREPDTESLQPFLRLHEVLREAYPTLFASAHAQVVAGGSLLMLLPGAQKAKPLLFLSHMDVAPVEEGTQDYWELPPFAGAVADGYVWGRGAWDRKGHLVALCEAADSLLQAGWRPSTDVWFAFSQDEEICGSSAKQMCRILQAQGVEPAFILDGGGAVEGDFAKVGVAEKGYADIVLSITGEGGHAAMIPAGTDLEKLALAAAVLSRYPMKLRLCPPVEWMLKAMAPRLPYFQQLAAAHPRFFWPLMKGMLRRGNASQVEYRSTYALTQAKGSPLPSMLSRHTSLTYHCRILPGDTVDDVIAHVRAAAGSGDIRLTVQNAEKPSSVSPAQGPAWDAMVTAIHILFPEVTPIPSLYPRTTDARCYEELGTNIYRFSPFVATPGEDSHRANERLSLKNLELGIQFFQQMLQA